MNAALLLAEARAASLHLWREGDRVRWRGDPPPELVTRLRARKSDLLELLRGNLCRRCGDPLAWPGPAGVVFADGTAECMPCADREVGRIWRAAERVASAPDALADPAEVMLLPGGME